MKRRFCFIRFYKGLISVSVYFHSDPKKWRGKLKKIKLHGTPVWKIARGGTLIWFNSRHTTKIRQLPPDFSTKIHTILTKKAYKLHSSGKGEQSIYKKIRSWAHNETYLTFDWISKHFWNNKNNHVWWSNLHKKIPSLPSTVTTSLEMCQEKIRQIQSSAWITRFKLVKGKRQKVMFKSTKLLNIHPLWGEHAQDKITFAVPK